MTALSFNGEIRVECGLTKLIAQLLLVMRKFKADYEK